MLTYPHIDPVAISLGPLKVHWYGLMYLCAFAGAYFLGRLRSQKMSPVWSTDQLSDLIFYAAMGVILGGRLGYVFFYSFDRFLEDPIWLFQVWKGGMSFHGGFLGVMVAMLFFAKRYQLGFWQVMDFVAPLVPTGILFGRLGNFIGGELWGRPVIDPNFPLAMVFPHVDNLARHPSQLYEAFLEGALLFAILWWFSSKPRPVKAVSGVFALGYGLARFTVEFFREPDADKGFIAFNWLTMGQLLTLPLIAVGILLLVLAYRQPAKV
ncbi:prolipoprotein diacylglyceryl transferase [Agitococcus lubricus]|uniref:Phosphatidylglycerol--prolipoprotein diacylglyceryl transferase n=1 Tax=Agitococcus lubricus TaxID=1077255 RepID=A0A2T5J2Y1_9GAMM|nr:prolipoprotein diacylglyceryl transferase [Agitococcus lubricus]PTQ90979.1 prolipoprotein diacylglyceryl transferase [Agitococcus lubricus]